MAHLVWGAVKKLYDEIAQLTRFEAWQYFLGTIPDAHLIDVVVCCIESAMVSMVAFKSRI